MGQGAENLAPPALQTRSRTLFRAGTSGCRLTGLRLAAAAVARQYVLNCSASRHQRLNSLRCIRITQARDGGNRRRHGSMVSSCPSAATARSLSPTRRRQSPARALISPSRLPSGSNHCFLSRLSFANTSSQATSTSSPRRTYDGASNWPSKCLPASITPHDSLPIPAKTPSPHNPHWHASYRQ